MLTNIIKYLLYQVFGKGSGKDCRVHAQKLNALRAERDGSNLTDDQFSAFLAASSHQVNKTGYPPAITQCTVSVKNKWNKYLENNDPEDETPEEDNRHLLQGPIYQKRKRQKISADSTGPMKNEELVISSNSSCNNTAVQNFTQEKQDASRIGVHCNQGKDFVISSRVYSTSKQNLREKSNMLDCNPSLNNTFPDNYLASSVSTDSDGEVKKSLIDVRKPSLSKWSKYLCHETDNDNDQSNELLDDSISSNKEFSYNAPNAASDSLENCISNKSPCSNKFACQQFTSEPFAVHEKQEKCSITNELLHSLFELKNEIETTEPCALTSTINCKNEESNEITVKKKFNVFEDDDLAWLDQVEDF